MAKSWSGKHYSMPFLRRFERFSELCPGHLLPNYLIQSGQETQQQAAEIWQLRLTLDLQKL